MKRLSLILAALLDLSAPALAQNRPLPHGEIRADGDISFDNALKLGKREGSKTVITPDRLQILGLGSSGDVSGMSALIPGENIARTLIGRLADIPLSIESFRGGACASAPDDTCAVQAAIYAAGAQKRELLLPGGITTVGALTFPSNVTIRGRGEGVSTLRLKSGTNKTLITSTDAYALFGTASEGGVFDFQISDLTLDGNRANNTAGACLAIYGARFRLRDLTLKQCPDEGLKTAWGQYGNGPMEASFKNILIDTAGKHGAEMLGPHDSIIDNLIIIDAGQLAERTYSQLIIAGFMNGRFSKVHTWHRATAANRTMYGLSDLSGYSDFSNSHFEGSATAPAYIAGNGSQYGNTNLYYAPWNTGSASIILAGQNNRVEGTILGSLNMPGQPPRTGIYVAKTAAGNIVDMIVLGSKVAALDLTGGDGGYNSFKIRGALAGGGGYRGEFSETTTVDLQVSGAEYNARMMKDASIPPPSSAKAYCVYGQRAFDANFEYRCTGPSTWKRSPLSTW